MVQNEYVFDNTVREPSKGITVRYPAQTRTIGEGEIHLQYASGAACAFNDGKLPFWTPGQCLLTENYLYFVGNTHQKDRQYLKIPISKIERVRKSRFGFGFILVIDVNVFAYSFNFSGSSAQQWMDSIVKLRNAPLKPADPTPDPKPQNVRFCTACGAKATMSDVYCCECGNLIK